LNSQTEQSLCRRLRLRAQQNRHPDLLAALGGEKWSRPRTLESLGLAGLDADGIRSLVEGEFVTPSYKTHHAGPRRALVAQA